MKNIYFLFIILSTACDANLEFSGATNHIYRNISDYTIEVKGYVNGEGRTDFELGKNQEYVYKYDPTEGENNPPYNFPFHAWDDSVVTIFDDTLAITYDIGRLDGNPMRISNYELIEAEKEPYIYLFEFTNEDYERALERGRIVK